MLAPATSHYMWAWLPFLLLLEHLQLQQRARTRNQDMDDSSPPCLYSFWAFVEEALSVRILKHRADSVEVREDRFEID